MKFALVGSPNSGKSVLFNFLTGLNQKVANYPGCTVVKKQGSIKFSKEHNCIDLPGAYSMHHRSQDVAIATDHILQYKQEKIDRFLVVCNSVSLQRSLVLVLQLKKLGVPFSVVLNMEDELLLNGGKIDVEYLEKELGAPVFLLSATRRWNIIPLVDHIRTCIQDKRQEETSTTKGTQDLASIATPTPAPASATPASAAPASAPPASAPPASAPPASAPPASAPPASAPPASAPPASAPPASAPPASAPPASAPPASAPPASAPPASAPPASAPPASAPPASAPPASAPPASAPPASAPPASAPPASAPPASAPPASAPPASAPPASAPPASAPPASAPPASAPPASAPPASAPPASAPPASAPPASAPPASAPPASAPPASAPPASAPPASAPPASAPPASAPPASAPPASAPPASAPPASAPPASAPPASAPPASAPPASAPPASAPPASAPPASAPPASAPPASAPLYPALTSDEIPEIATLENEIIRISNTAYTKLSQSHDLSDKLDGILLHPWWGRIILVVFAFLIFQSIFTWVTPIMNAITFVFDLLASNIKILLADNWLSSLIGDGVILGIGSVLVFLPQILVITLVMGIMEMSGYMARATFLMDSLFQKIGLQGKVFIPLLTGHACAIPGIMACRTISNPIDRLITIFTVPFMSCSARLPVYTMLITAFIPDQQLLGFISIRTLVLIALYLGGSIVGIGISGILKLGYLFFNKNHSPLIFDRIAEIPQYRIPSVYSLFMYSWARVKLFIKRASTIILGISILFWVLTNIYIPGYPRDIEYTIAGVLGKVIHVIFRPMGLDWQSSVAVLIGLTAREVFIGAASVLYHAEGLNVSLSNVIATHLSMASGISLLVYYIYAPQCLATFAVMFKETKNRIFTAASFLTMLGIAYLFAYITYRIVLLV